MIATPPRRIAWYRSPVKREALAALNQRSDAAGLLQPLGHLGLLALTAGGAWYAVDRLPAVVFLLILYLHGLLGLPAQRVPRALPQDRLQNEGAQHRVFVYCQLPELV